MSLNTECIPGFPLTKTKKPKPPATTIVLAPVAVPLSNLVAAANTYVASSRASATRRAYATDREAFDAWRAYQGGLGVTGATVVTYLASLADAGKKLATIRRAAAGIAHAYPIVREDPQIRSQVREALRGIACTIGAAPSPKTPVGPELLLKLIEKAGVRDRALLLLGWHGAFRRSELVALDVEDLTFKPEGMVVHVKESKTDQEAQGDTVGVVFSKNPKLCPVRAVLELLKKEKLKTGPLFRTRDERLGASSVALIVKRHARRAGVDTVQLAAHSLRSGLATTAAENGKGLDTIMRQGRWKSTQTVMRYIRPSTVFKSNATEGLT